MESDSEFEDDFDPDEADINDENEFDAYDESEYESEYDDEYDDEYESEEYDEDIFTEIACPRCGGMAIDYFDWWECSDCGSRGN
jgi:ribosomal protein S27AE